ncbi:putative transmembrane protein TMEM64 [Helianthus annuus]|nr:putative transmembrane protein TMEM64 [Helianthus annuus]
MERLKIRDVTLRYCTGESSRSASDSDRSTEYNRRWEPEFSESLEVIPILNWETETFSKLALAFIIFSSVAIFPTVFIPSIPSMWVAGMSFD